MTNQRPWECVVQEFAQNKYVRKRSKNCYEVSLFDRGQYVYIGSFPSMEIASVAALKGKIDMVRKNIIAAGFDPSEIVAASDAPYLAHANGTVFNVHGHVIHPHPDRHGYLQTLINGKSRRIHLIIARTFIPNPDNLPCVNHKDGNKANNDITNLEWCTHSENTLHSFRAGLQIPSVGEESSNHKLTAEQVRYIRQVYIPRDRQYGAAALAKRFSVTRTTIVDAFNRVTWRCI